MNDSVLRDAQLEMASYLRNPQQATPPAGIESRRLQVYRDLIFNNIEGFLSGGFPVLRQIYSDDDWLSLVQAFLDNHRCQTPYFLEISQEFIAYLAERHEPRDCDPPSLAELAHYEWVELALDIALEEPPGPPPGLDPLVLHWHLSPVAWVLSYRFPVHRIGPGFNPESAGEPCFLVVYRDRGETVRFMELNAATARLLELVRDGGGLTGRAVLEQLAGELQMDTASVLAFGAEQLNQFAARGVIGGAPPG